MRVFVTGGNGFIGSIVVKALVTGGHHVRCLLRAASKTERIDGLAYERADGDVRDSLAVKQGMAGCDTVIHLASLSNWNDINSPLMTDVVIGGTQNILDAARQRPRGERPRVVFVSSTLAINASDEPRIFDETAEFTQDEGKLSYSRCKRRAEEMCRRAVADDGLDVTIVNPAEVYGPEDTSLITAGNLIDFAKSDPVLVCRGGTAVTHVEDVANGIVAAAEKGRAGERYILAGENLTIRELAGLTLEILGQGQGQGKKKKKAIVEIPNGVLRAVGSLGRTFKIPLPFNPHVIPYATRFWFMDSRKAQTELGVSFRPAREALVPTLAWLKETGRIPA